MYIYACCLLLFYVQSQARIPAGRAEAGWGGSGVRLGGADAHARLLPGRVCACEQQADRRLWRAMFVGYFMFDHCQAEDKVGGRQGMRCGGKRARRAAAL